MTRTLEDTVRKDAHFMDTNTPSLKSSFSQSNPLILSSSDKFLLILGTLLFPLELLFFFCHSILPDTSFLSYFYFYFFKCYLCFFQSDLIPFSHGGERRSQRAIWIPRVTWSVKLAVWMLLLQQTCKRIPAVLTFDSSFLIKDWIKTLF